MSVSLIMLDIKGAPGDVTIAGYENHIVVESFTWSATAATVEKLTDDPVTKVDAKAVSIKKHFDRSSTRLWEMMKSDKPFTATLRFLDPTSRSAASVKGQGKIDEILEIQLLGCHIDRISFSADDSGKAVDLSEDLVISYETSANLSYRAYDPVKKMRAGVMTASIPASEKAVSES